jgi:signal transduction histidine kinase
LSTEPAGGSTAAGTDAALAAYAGFVAHQLGEIAVLAGAMPPGGPADLVRARIELMLADVRDLSPQVRESEAFDLPREAELVAEDLSEPGQPVRLDVEGQAPAASGDPQLLRALLGHLMRPVVAASPGGVSFVLTAARDGDRVRFELADDAGAASADGAATRLSSYGTRAGGGQLLGAGVSGPAAARIVAAHGGEIAIRPTDEGASAVFDLPAGGTTKVDQ